MQGVTGVITTICLNPCFDRTVEVDSLKLNSVNRIRTARDDLGGKGINVAIVAQRLGLDVQCLGLMGVEGAAELSQQMDREGLKHTFLKIRAFIAGYHIGHAYMLVRFLRSNGLLNIVTNTIQC